jgi:hypothetical protein
MITDADMMHAHALQQQAKWDAAHQPDDNPDWPMGCAMIAGNPWDDVVQNPAKYVSRPEWLPKEMGL